jgi:hypothetical protein
MVDTIARVQPERIVITSPGGQLDAGLDLADFIATRKTAVEAVGLCGSVCAQYIFVASPQRSVATGTVLIFHNTATAMKAIVSNDPDESVRKFFDSRAVRELQLYRVARIDVRLLLIPVIRMDTSCYDVLRTDDGRVVNIRFRAHLDGWSAPKEVLQAVGLQYSGNSPSTTFEFENALKQSAHVDPGRFAFDASLADITFEEALSRLSLVQRCGQPTVSTAPRG